MFDKIVLAVDGSEGAKKAIPVVVDLATKSHGEVLVVYVDEMAAWRDTALSEKGLPEAREVADAVVDELSQAGVNARAKLCRSGTAGVAKEILECADDFGADCIVMGSRGRGDLAGLLLGSVTHKVVQLAHCPVIVVR
jgi:Universal stress protein UspA and related nucleotide-binding proteins